MAILPGQGLGPIRFGATVATVERLMEAKCEELTDRVCRYLSRGAEFELEHGRVVGMRVHRPDRPAGVDAAGVPVGYGMFNGYIPPDPEHGRPLEVMFGMHAPGVQASFGPPLRVELAPAGNPNGTREIHYYEDVVFEYDEVPGAFVPVLGGIRILKRPG